MPTTGPVTVVLVEDDPDQAQLIEEILRRLRLTNNLMVFPTGQDVLNYLLAEPSQTDMPPLTSILLLLNLSLPGLDGYQILERMKADGRTTSIPVIMLTQADEPADIERCRALGCNSVVTKPVESSTFVEAIRQAGLFLSVVSAPTEPPC